MFEIIIVIVCLLILCATVLLYIKLNRQAGKGEMDKITKERDELFTGTKILEEKLINLNERLSEASLEIRKKDEVILELNRRISKTDAEFSGLTEKLVEQKAELENLQQRFRTEFKNLASEILEEKKKK